jgi:hypothetical protein
MNILARERPDARANNLQAREQLLDPKIAEGVTAFQDKSLQGHRVALRAIGKGVSNTADWGIERSVILTAGRAHFCKVGLRMG